MNVCVFVLTENSKIHWEQKDIVWWMKIPEGTNKLVRKLVRLGWKHEQKCEMLCHVKDMANRHTVIEWWKEVPQHVVRNMYDLLDNNDWHQIKIPRSEKPQWTEWADINGRCHLRNSGLPTSGKIARFYYSLAPIRLHTNTTKIAREQTICVIQTHSR